MKYYEDKIIDVLSDTLKKNEILGEKKYNIMKYMRAELESINLPTIPSL